MAHKRVSNEQLHEWTNSIAEVRGQILEALAQGPKGQAATIPEKLLLDVCEELGASVANLSSLPLLYGRESSATELVDPDATVLVKRPSEQAIVTTPKQKSVVMVGSSQEDIDSNVESDNTVQTDNQSESIDSTLSSGTNNQNESVPDTTPEDKQPFNRADKSDGVETDTPTVDTTTESDTSNATETDMVGEAADPIDAISTEPELKVDISDLVEEDTPEETTDKTTVMPHATGEAPRRKRGFFHRKR